MFYLLFLCCDLTATNCVNMVALGLCGCSTNWSTLELCNICWEECIIMIINNRKACCKSEFD